ncbi:hypothetical protein HK101_005977 [Irineochytrium annulatum]|nr:hypothetical protein HK101_005977 [Irineochytrium annulatum]
MIIHFPCMGWVPPPCRRLAVLAPPRRLQLASRRRFSSTLHPPSRSIQALSNPLLDIHPEVRDCLARGAPLVALESTIISHGMPYPRNEETALEVERIVRENGATPATIAIMDGRIKVGLNAEDLTRLATAGHKEVAKVSRRDMALLLSRRDGMGQPTMGATTVSATMIAADLCGISVFVTGGIGGVHRGAESTMDISADLTELSRTPVTVVCAGVKSILDIPRTLEVLETLGVPVVTCHPSPEFPSFYTPRSGHKAIAALPDPADCARMISASERAGLRNGHVVAVPILEEDVRVDDGQMERAIVDALREAGEKGVKGKDVTPFLLEKVSKLTGGGSLESNVALIRNNARVGTRIAVELARLRGGGAAGSARATTKVVEKLTWTTCTAIPRPVIFGGTNVDITSQPNRPPSTKADDGAGRHEADGDSHPGKVSVTLGGVGRNVAEACHHMGGKPIFHTAVGTDAFGDIALGNLKGMGMDMSGVKVVDKGRTAVYSAMLRGSGALRVAVADMDIHDAVGNDVKVEGVEGLIVLDGNVSQELMARCVRAKMNGKEAFGCLFEPTSGHKAERFIAAMANDDLKAADVLGAVQFVTPNSLELGRMMDAAAQLKLVPWPHSTKASELVERTNDVDRNSGVVTVASALARLFPIQIIKLGREGVLLVRRLDDGGRVIKGIDDRVRVEFRHIRPAVVLSDVISVTGAGDSLVGAFVAALLREAGTLEREEKNGRVKLSTDVLERCVRVGMRAAEASLVSERAVGNLSTVFADDGAVDGPAITWVIEL